MNFPASQSLHILAPSTNILHGKFDVYWTVHHIDNCRIKSTRCHLLLYYAYVSLNMFWAPLCPSSGAHDDSVDYHIGRLVLELLLIGI